MKIKMQRSLAGPSVAYHVGHEYDVDEAFGEALCADGRAEPVDAAPKPKRSRTSKRPAAPNVETR